MHADQPTSRRIHLYCVPADITFHSTNTPHAECGIRIEMEDNPGPRRAGGGLCADPLIAVTDFVDGEVLCSVSFRSGREPVRGQSRRGWHGIIAAVEVFGFGRVQNSIVSV